MTRPVPPPRQQVAPSATPPSVPKAPPEPEGELLDASALQLKLAPTDVCDFLPMKDITAYELATILTKLDITCTPEALTKLPSSVSRHFKPRSRGDSALRRPG